MLYLMRSRNSASGLLGGCGFFRASGGRSDGTDGRVGWIVKLTLVRGQRL